MYRNRNELEAPSRPETAQKRAFCQYFPVHEGNLAG